MWSAYLTRIGQASSGIKLESVLLLLRDFLMPPVNALILNEPFYHIWPPGGSWKKQKKKRGERKSK